MSDREANYTFATSTEEENKDDNGQNASNLDDSFTLSNISPDDSPDNITSPPKS